MPFQSQKDSGGRRQNGFSPVRTLTRSGPFITQTHSNPKESRIVNCRKISTSLILAFALFPVPAAHADMVEVLQGTGAPTLDQVLNSPAYSANRALIVSMARGRI